MLPDDQINPPPVAPERPLWLENLWSESWRLMRANYLMLLVAGVVLAGVAGISALVGYLVPYLDIAFDVFVSWPIQAGSLILGVRLARGPRPVLGDLFAGFHHYWPLVGVGVFLEAITFAITKVPILLGAGSPFASQNSLMVALGCGGGLVLFVLLVAIQVRFWIAPALCLDEYSGKPGPLMSIIAAWGISGPSFWRLFLVQFASGVMLIGSILLLGVGLVLLGLPLYICVFGVVYARLMGPIPIGVCVECGYDTTASPNPVCPECGNPTGVELPSPIIGGA